MIMAFVICFYVQNVIPQNGMIKIFLYSEDSQTFTHTMKITSNKPMEKNLHVHGTRCTTTKVHHSFHTVPSHCKMLCHVQLPKSTIVSTLFYHTIKCCDDTADRSTKHSEHQSSCSQKLSKTLA